MSYLFPTYSRWNINIKQAKGTKVVDTNGKTYLDFISGIGVCNLGHCHPKIVEAIQTQANQVMHVSNLFEIGLQEKVAEKLVHHSFGDAVFFCNSGAEANEAAIKLARKHTGKSKIITCTQSFHGRTFATMGATGQEKVKKGFGPMLETFVHVPFNDINALKEVVDEETAAIMIEVVQGEGGVHPAEPSYIKEIEQLCQEKNILFIIDEVQTGIGRTGKRFAHEHYNVEPDIISLAKGLGSGFPVGAIIGKKKLIPSFSPGSHGTTFGGNPLAMAAAYATLNIVFADEFLHDVQKKSDYLIKKLTPIAEKMTGFKKLKYKGLMIGIEFASDTTDMITKLRENGLLVLNAGPNVIRLLPPLTVTQEEIDEALTIINNACK